MAAERNPPEEVSLLASALQWLTESTLASPRGTLAICLASAALAVMYAVNGLEFKANRLDLLSPRSEYNRRWLNYLSEFGRQDDAVIVVQGKSPAEIEPVVNELAAALQPQTKLFEAILYRRDLSAIKAKALHFLPPDELRRIEQQAVQAADVLQHGPGSADPVKALTDLNDNLDRLGVSSPDSAQALVAGYAALAGGLLPAVAPQSPPLRMNGATPSMPKELDQLHTQPLLAADGRLGFLLLKLVETPSAGSQQGKAIAELRRQIEASRVRHPNLWIGLTGMPIIEHDEMESSSVDTTVSTLVSLVAVALLFVAGYGGLRHAGMACAALLIGIGWSFGYVTVVVGHLNILSASFGAILIGLGIDFGIHYVASYLQLRERGMPTHEALVRTSHDVGPGVVTGAITTAAAFFTAGLTEFVGVAELGIVAGGGVLCCLMSALIALPPMILMADKYLPRENLPQILPVSRWLRPLHAFPTVTIVLMLLLSVGMTLGLGGLHYDHNLLNLQPRRLESSAIERELFTKLDDSVWFAVSMCDSREEVQERAAKFAKLPSVAKIEEISSLTATPDPIKSRAIARIQESVLTAQRSQSAKPLNVQALLVELQRAEGLLTSNGLSRSPALFTIAGLKQALVSMPAEESARRLQQQRNSLQREIAAGLSPLREICDPVPPSTDDLPPELSTRFIGKTQKHLIKIYARGDIWDMDRLERFVGDVESIDPFVSGHPVQTYYASRHMQMSYLQAGAMALVAVFGLVYLDFQSLRMTLLAMLPLALGTFSLFGLIGWLGIPLNAANMIVLPLILGIGVDDGVHLVHDLRRQKGRFKMSDSTAVAVLLTSTTTMVSFGTMILARHQGLQSLGQVLTLGTTLCLGMSLIGFPALLSWLTRHREELDEEQDFVTAEESPAIHSADTETEVPPEEPLGDKPSDSLPAPHFATRPRRRLTQLQDTGVEDRT